MNETPVWKTLLKLSPPVMLALLIQSVYNIVDSYFVARYAPEGLTALSLIFPIQLLMTAIAVGTGTGINILISRMEGTGDIRGEKNVEKSGLFLGVFNFSVFTFLGLLFLKPYCHISSSMELVRQYAFEYAQIILLLSFGMFVEAHCTKILQAKRNMVLPMCAQVTGAIVNVILDPLLIFGSAHFPKLGIRGAAIATVIGQWIAMLLVLIPVLKEHPFSGKFTIHDCLRIYQSGLAAILTQALNTVYVIGLNLILKQFTEDAVTVLGIYYKLQTFFFIPLFGLQQVVLPVISYFYGAGNNKKIQQALRISILMGSSVMAVGFAVFLFFPKALLGIFSSAPGILSIGTTALRIISVSFIPAAFLIMFTVYFQGVGRGSAGIAVTVFRQVFLLVPLAWLFHFFGLRAVWLTFPVTEFLSLSLCFYLYYEKKKHPASSLIQECPGAPAES